MNQERSVRARVVERRTYNRPLNEEGTVFESWEQTVDRVIGHQRWLWERALGGMRQNRNGEWVLRPLNLFERAELEELRDLMLAHEVSMSGRTLWLGGTAIAKKREASQFNCSFSTFGTVADVCDHFWLLLQGCGVGDMARLGVVNGLAQETEFEVVRSAYTKADWEAGRRGSEHTTAELEFDDETDREVYRITFGDSAEGWVRGLGKLMTFKGKADVIVLDFSQVRAAGIRLRGYGWISSGDEKVSKHMAAIGRLLSSRAGKLLSRIDMLDVENHLGETLSSRRSAEIVLCPYGDPEWRDFATAKKDHFLSPDTMHRRQSNNTLLFWQKPTRDQLQEVFDLMQAAGGSEPGFANAVQALRRAPWFAGFNPCAEILLGDKSFCNLVETDLGKFNGRFEALKRAIYVVARANYRQTCVWLKDGVLQDTWHELNEYLHLCGVGLTGLVRADFMHGDRASAADALAVLRSMAHEGAHGMADELGFERSKAITTVKPSGTLGKKMDTTEGGHKPLGKYIFNRIEFGKHDPLVPILKAANYEVVDHPLDSQNVLINLPVSYDDVEFEGMWVERKMERAGEHGPEVVTDTVYVEVNQESAIAQLDRYKLLMDNYVDHNASITVYYDPTEVPAIIDWFTDNWDCYVGVSFLYRTDPTKTALDLGYAYLPQTCVTKEEYDAYVEQLLPVELDAGNALIDMMDEGCATGACPIR